MREGTQEEGGGFRVEFPDFPECAASGATPESALTDGADVIRSWVAGMKAAGQIVPTPITDPWADPYVDHLCDESEETQNPVIFFEALGTALANAVDDPAGRVAGLREEADYVIRLSPALYGYLRSISADITALGNGRDFREAGAEPLLMLNDPSRYDGNFYTPVAEREWITPDAARDLVLAALGFVRPGWSALASSRRRAQRQSAATDLAIAEERGDARAVRAEWKAKLNLGDDRSFRRFVAEPTGRTKPRG